MERRAFLKSAAAATAAIPFGAFLSRVEAESGSRQRAVDATYGPLASVADETTGLPLLMLPVGFRYLSLGWTGDPMSSGTGTPSAHDGMAAFPAGGRHLGWSGNASELSHDGQQDGGQRRGHLAVLVRNHEQGRGTPFSGAAYDLAASGGTTTLVFDSQRGDILESWGSISGTIRNCAGGPTPWDGERNGISGDFRGSEFAGACYSPDGNWLFVNVQSPGITSRSRDPGTRARCNVRIVRVVRRSDDSNTPICTRQRDRPSFAFPVSARHVRVPICESPTRIVLPCPHVQLVEGVWAVAVGSGREMKVARMLRTLEFSRR